MKVHINVGEKMSLLGKRVELEGHTLSGLREADLVVIDTPIRTTVPVVVSGDNFSWVILDQLGLDVCEEMSGGVLFYLTRWWGGRENGWSRQVWCGIPLWGLQEGGRGVRVESGTVGVYVEAPDYEEIWSKFDETLGEMGHRGFFTLGVGKDGRVVEAESGVGGWGFYGMMEGVGKGGVVEWLASEEKEKSLKESWTTTLVVSRWPWPFTSREVVVTSGRVTGLSKEVERHFWIRDYGNTFKGVVTATETLVGVATSWGRTLCDSVMRAGITASRIEVEGKQYRGDAEMVAGEVWGMVKTFGVRRTVGI